MTTSMHVLPEREGEHERAASALPANLVLSPSVRARSKSSAGARSGWGGVRSPRGGRPKWEPNAEQVDAIQAAASAGLTQDVIATLVGVSESTLKRRCADQLRLGSLHCNARVALAAFEMAISGNHPAMTRFWLAMRAGWK